MTGNNSLCPYTDPYLTIPLQAQYLPPEAPVFVGHIYGYAPSYGSFDRYIHRLAIIDAEQKLYYFKGDSNDYLDFPVPRNKIAYEIINVKK